MIFFVVLLLLTLPLYLGSIAITLSMQSNDIAGRGLSRSFAYILTAALWTVLTALTVTAYLQGNMSTGSAIAALLLVPASAAVAFRAISSSHLDVPYPVGPCAIVPLLIATFACWANFPPFRNAVPEGLIGGVIWFAVLACSIGSWLKKGNRSPANAPQNVDDRPREPADHRTTSGISEPGKTAHSSSRRSNNREAFLALTPHVSLQKWLPFIAPTSDVRDEALVAIRQSPRRQADAEFLLKTGCLSLWQDVPLLDLRLTPMMAEIGRKFIRERARDIAPLHPTEAPNFEYISSRIEPYLGAIEWLVEQHCDCRAELLSLSAAVQLYPESEKRNTFLAELAALRPPAVVLSRPFPARTE